MPKAILINKAGKVLGEKALGMTDSPVVIEYGGGTFIPSSISMADFSRSVIIYIQADTVVTGRLDKEYQ